MMLEANSAVPLYQQVAEDLKKRIEQGEFLSGQSIPSEAKLCEQYQVSRITVRNAIADLVEQEILVTYHGKGAFVRTPKISSSLSTFKGFTYFCSENNIKTYTHMLAVEKQKASAMISKKLELDAKDSIIYLKRLRHVNEKPVMIEHVYLPYKGFEFLMNTDMENKSLYEEIEKHTGLRLEDNCYTSIMLETSLTTEEERELMRLPAPDAVFVLTETIYMNTGKPVHVTKQILSGEYFKFFMSNKVNQLSMNWKKVKDGNIL
ncbi:MULTISPECIES: GntR family transcriptional regulator [Clostridia]|uniref:GntR family transcriptional regulator n=1 Tax=Clostridia TaxID=186801 RepID=UPI000AE57A2E|nr:MULTISPECIES: GntR family transcriptional regulator [Clostridia]